MSQHLVGQRSTASRRTSRRTPRRTWVGQSGTVTVPRLQVGDRVRFVSPSSTPSPEAVARGVEVLTEWGLRVEIGAHVFDRLGYLAGSDADRLADLDDALRDPGVRAIFAARGGKGAYRIAGQLDFDAARADPKPVVGFSDITILHLAMLNHGAAGAIHGPLVNWNDDYYSKDCADRMRRALMTDDPVVVTSNPTDYTAQLTGGEPASGPLIGGNLDTVRVAVGWALPSLRGAILLLEDFHGTGLGQIDRSLTQLINSGLLEGLAGVALGTFGEFETARAEGWGLADVLRDRFALLGVPVLGGLPVGHGRDPATVPLGTEATMDPSAGTLTVGAAVE